MRVSGRRAASLLQHQVRRLDRVTLAHAVALFGLLSPRSSVLSLPLGSSSFPRSFSSANVAVVVLVVA